MSDLIYYKNGEETFRISPPTVETKCPKTKLEVKKMTEIEKTEGEIKVLQAKLELLKEMENYKSPVEEAYKDAYGHYPLIDENDCCRWEGKIWFAFQNGYEAHQSLVDDAKKIIDEASMINCVLEGNPPDGCSDWRSWFELFGSKGILNGLRLSSIDKTKPEPEFPDEPIWYDEVEWDISENAPPKPAVSLYARLDDGFLYSRSGICKKVRDFLLDESAIEYEDGECITFTLHKSLLDAPND